MTENSLKCQKCGSPVTPAMKFCESCGARIEAGPVCSQCGAPLAPGARFCESCGKPTAAATPAALAETPASAPSPETSRPAETAAPTIEEKQPEAETKSVPEERPAAPPAKAAAAPVKETIKEPPRVTGPKKPIPQMTMIIAGVIVLALLGAAVYFIVLPMMSGPWSTSQGTSGQTAVPTAAGSSGSSAQAAAGSGAAELTAGPTQALPENRELIIDVERDPITSIITVKFQGGGGQYATRELAVTLTRSDGTVEEKSFKPEYRGTFITLRGTEKTDRVEITANFYNGESYKVVDKILEYKRRNW